jgi:acetylornithine deacetylase
MIPEFQALALKRPIHILLSYDEETTCLGPVDTIARFGRDLPRPGAVIVGEPTLMQVADAHKSVATYVTHVRGHEAHSSNPMLGANAIEAACALVGELYRFMEDCAAAGDPGGRFVPGQSTVSVGVIQGGTARNILARDCSFHWEFRGLPGVAQDAALRHLEGVIARDVLPRLRRYAPQATIETVAEVEVPGLAPEPGSPAEALAFKASRRNATIAVSYATEAGRFQGAGIPTIVCGPGSIEQAHQPDEFLEESQLAEECEAASMTQKKTARAKTAQGGSIIHYQSSERGAGWAIPPLRTPFGAAPPRRLRRMRAWHAGAHGPRGSSAGGGEGRDRCAPVAWP